MDKTMDVDELDAQRKEIGARLASVRKEKNFTQAQMAEMFGISQTAYQKYEYGREIKSTMLIKLCAILECSPSWLLGVEDEGYHLASHDPIMESLSIAYEKLNTTGKKKVVTYAEDLSCNSDMVIEVKSARMQDNKISGVA